MKLDDFYHSEWGGAQLKKSYLIVVIYSDVRTLFISPQNSLWSVQQDT